MKFFLTVLVLLFLRITFAQTEIGTPFWLAAYPDEPLVIPLQPIENLHEDCRAFAQAAMKNISAAELQLARSLPVQGQMRNSYEAYFEIPPQFEKTLQLSFTKPALVRNYQQKEVIVSVDLPTLKDFGPLMEASEKSLTSLARRLQLPPSPVELIKKTSLFLKVGGRDVACDLLNRHLSFQANARQQLSLTGGGALRLNAYHSEIEKITQEVLARNEVGAAKAARLGIRLAHFFGEAREENLHFWWPRLFNENSLEPGPNWKILGDRKFLQYERVKDIGFRPVRLTLQDFESEAAKISLVELNRQIQNLEKEMAAYAEKNYDAMTERQLQRLQRLNGKKVAFLKNYIFRKYQKLEHR